MNLHIHQLDLFQQHSESFKIWSAIIRINTEGKSLIMKLGPCISGADLSTSGSFELWIAALIFCLYHVKSGRAEIAQFNIPW